MSKSKVIVAKDLNLGYKNENIIENGSFSLNSGDFVFLTGASGSGKTTLLRHLYGELKAKSGYLNIGGFDMMKISKSKLTYLRRYIGIVFQDYKLIQEYTIAQNITLPLEIKNYSSSVIEKQLKNLLKHVKLTHKIGAYPAELSGGEQQRVAVARAFSDNPDLILADEPTGNLDDYSSDMIWSLLKNANEVLGTTIVVVTHRIPKNMGIKYRRFNIEEGVLYEAS